MHGEFDGRGHSKAAVGLVVDGQQRRHAVEVIPRTVHVFAMVIFVLERLLRFAMGRNKHVDR